MFSHEALVGVKCMKKRVSFFSSQARNLRVFVRAVVVTDDVELLA
jgi:hypothetical protein